MLSVMNGSSTAEREVDSGFLSENSVMGFTRSNRHKTGSRNVFTVLYTRKKPRGLASELVGFPILMELLNPRDEDPAEIPRWAPIC